jgi:putative transcriptional regulator
MQAKQIRDLRYSLKMTQEQFATKLGVTTSSIRRWEKGEAQPSPLALKIIELLSKNQTADTLNYL